MKHEIIQIKRKHPLDNLVTEKQRYREIFHQSFASGRAGERRHTGLVEGQGSFLEGMGCFLAFLLTDLPEQSSKLHFLLFSSILKAFLRNSPNFILCSDVKKKNQSKFYFTIWSNHQLLSQYWTFMKNRRDTHASNQHDLRFSLLIIN